MAIHAIESNDATPLSNTVSIGWVDVDPFVLALLDDGGEEVRGDAVAKNWSFDR